MANRYRDPAQAEQAKPNSSSRCESSQERFLTTAAVQQMWTCFQSSRHIRKAIRRDESCLVRCSRPVLADSLGEVQERKRRQCSPHPPNLTKSQIHGQTFISKTIATIAKGEKVRAKQGLEPLGQRYKRANLGKTSKLGQTTARQGSKTRLTLMQNR